MSGAPVLEHDVGDDDDLVLMEYVAELEELERESEGGEGEESNDEEDVPSSSHSGSGYLAASLKKGTFDTNHKVIPHQ